MPQAERQLLLSELGHYQPEVALQRTAPSLCVGNYISLVKSEVTCSLAGDLSCSQLKQSTQDYANRSAWLGGVSSLQHYLYEQKHCTYFCIQHLEKCSRGSELSLESVSTRSGLQVEYYRVILLLDRNLTFLVDWPQRLDLILTFTRYFITWQHLYRLLDYLLNC